MEHLQKIPYLLSIFFPIALFFSLGLGIAYILWHKHTRRLVSALKVNNNLNDDLARIYGSGFTDKGISSEKLEQIEANWKLNLEAETNKYSELELQFSNFKAEQEREYNTLLDSNNTLQSGIEGEGDNTAELEAKLATLQSSYNDSQDSISKLTTQLKIIELEKEETPDSSANDELESKITTLQDQVSTKDDELEKLRLELNSANSTSEECSDLKTQFTNLQSQLNDKDSEIKSLKAELDAAKSVTTEANSSADTPIQTSEQEVPESFSDDKIKEDEKLGIIYTSRPDEVDDLKLIKGVAKVLEAKLHEIGIYKFKQIADWDETHMAEFSDRLAFPGRIQRDDWKTQATQFYKDKYESEA